ncbi:MAG: dihydropteroate synthase [Nitrososphaerota archaeon]
MKWGAPVSLIRGFLGRVEAGDKLPTRIIGVINVSPESFYKGSVKMSYEEIVETALYMVKSGADIIDVGAMSTAPYLQTYIDEEEEARRIREAIEAVKSSIDVPVSADTHRVKPALEAVKAGAEIINDVTGLSNPAIAEIVAEHNLSLIICARNLGKLSSPREAVESTLKVLERSLKIALEKNVDINRIAIDPAIGFHRDTGIDWWKIDLELIRSLEKFRRLGRPIVIGVSRKSFIGILTGKEKPEDRLFGSKGVEAIAVFLGAHVIRTHDVPEAVDVVRVAEAIRKTNP